MNRLCNRWSWIGGLTVSVLLCSCSQQGGPKGKGEMMQGKSEMKVEKEAFGTTLEGQKVHLFRLINGKGMEADIMTYGAIMVRLLVPDKNGKSDDVVLGFDSLAGYLQGHPYFGAIVGRYGNRIAKGKFTLDGTEYTLAVNNMNANHLHGGLKGFDKAVWDAEAVQSADAVGVKLSHTSKDGDEGYPGNLKCSVTYWLTDKNELKLEYEATTDKPTPVNLTNHSYFNLAGAGNGDNLSHVMMLNADRFLPVDKTLIPTGELRPVKGTPFDFTRPTPIGKNINADDEQVKFGNGWDHCWVLNKPKPGELTLCARVTEPTSGRVMEMLTTEPAVQFYSGNFLDGTNVGKGGKKYEFRYGFCLESEHYPDSPNHPEFPSTILRPGQEYRTTTIYRFSTR
jgi:aldose 1-epimerase